MHCIWNCSLFFFQVPIDFWSDHYDLDIDHEMYFGSRLLEKELIYTKELHDKLPITQYLFLLPAQYGGVFTFKIICIAIILISGAYLYYIGVSIYKNSEKKQRHTILLSTTLLYLALHAQLFLFHLSTIASCFITISAAIYLNQSLNSKTRKNRFHSLNVGGLISGVIAVSFRPYLFVPFMLMTISSVIRDLYLSVFKASTNCSDGIHINNYRYLTKVFLVNFASFSVIALIINGVPYLLTNQLANFYDGIRHNLQKLNPSSYLDVLIHEKRIFSQLSVGLQIQFVIYVLLLSLFSLLVIFDKRQSNLKQETLFYISIFMIVPIILLQISIISRHFWPHYLEMFIPFIVIGYMFIIKEIISVFNAVFTYCIKHLYYLIILIGTISTCFGISQSVVDNHPSMQKLDLVKAVLTERVMNNSPRDFIYLSNMYVHWKLQESRHGFPHAANIDHINRQWWINVQKSNIIDFPYTKQQICSKLTYSNIAVIFTEIGSSEYECMLKLPDKYELHLQDKVSVFFKK